jgi:hypothetical protein
MVNAVDVVDGAIAETLEMVQMVKDKQLTRTRNLLQKHRTRQRARTGLLRRSDLRVAARSQFNRRNEGWRPEIGP